MKHEEWTEKTSEDLEPIDSLKNHLEVVSRDPSGREFLTPRTTLKTVLDNDYEYHFEIEESETNLDFIVLRGKLLHAIKKRTSFGCRHSPLGGWDVECERLYKILEMHGWN